ncbi:hypothetical protein SAMN04487906_2906 [Zhouia amylolytica]|uniref:DUF4350 domain-containing protein n=1 Tax=Zhouia amylolytica TaxID=376730 RepID=A0A1I6V6X1_9FLAO|nr:DUF4350 domain-containing protein [Zhouia amylolytica]SFT09355.1 hypothetical protein SAMN04487906_2906 [Zhouia amylolytica]
MNKTLKVYIGVLILLIIGIFVLEITKPTPIDWSPTFNEKHTKPYGLKVLYQELPSLFKNQELLDINITPFEYFDNTFDQVDSTYGIKGSYLYIHDDYMVDEVSAEKLLDFAGEGNSIFISSTQFPQTLKDSLDFKIKYEYSFSGKATLTLANPQFSRDSITIDKNAQDIYFKELDSLTTIVLGFHSISNEAEILDINQKEALKDHINFVKINYKSGTFYLHTQPYAFTNYYLLKENNFKYIENVMSYLPDQTILFDSVNKEGKELGSSPFRFILSEPSLKWAWYICLIVLITFMVFNAKREQRTIRIIKALPNTTVDFTKTIANLYYETKDHSNLINKKITYFLEKIRTDYFIDTDNLDDKFAKNLALKAGKNKESMLKLVRLIKYLKSRGSHSEAHLLELNKQIEEFYNTN